MKRDPHYLRFARALALVTGLAGVSATGCSDDTTPSTTDSGIGGNDASLGVDSGPGPGTDSGPGPGTDSGPLADAGDVDAGIDCEACTCGGPLPEDSGTTPTCSSLGALHEVQCCAAVGPLYPPDMPA